MAGRHIIRARWRVPNPVPALDGQPTRGSQVLRPLWLRLRVDRGRARIERAPSCGNLPRHRMEPHMSDLSLAQNHALDLARTLCHAKEPG